MYVHNWSIKFSVGLCYSLFSMETRGQPERNDRIEFLVQFNTLKHRIFFSLIELLEHDSSWIQGCKMKLC